MICARCNRDSKRKERTAGRCPHCGGAFAFKQGSRDPISDRGFARAIEVVSAGGHMRWGVEHLYYEVSRRASPDLGWKGGLIAVSLIVVIALLFAMGFRFWVIGLAVLCAFAITFVLKRSQRKHNLPKERFDALWARWRSVHGMPAGVIMRRQEIGAAGPQAAEPDLALYSFDRAVVCDRARTVDLLLANNFHFENNCAVLSVDGYPRGVFDTVLGMLRRNPRLRIFALHDCTVSGCALARKLASSPEWFQGQTVVDVGLRPVHARKLPNLIPAQGIPVPALGIDRDELDWLSRHTVELAVLRPEQILRRLFRAMTKEEDGDSSSGSTGGDGGGATAEYTVRTDEESFQFEAGADDGGADGFG